MEQTAEDQVQAPVKEKVPTRPGSQWATGKRKNQKGFNTAKGYARGARTKQS